MVILIQLLDLARVLPEYPLSIIRLDVVCNINILECALYHGVNLYGVEMCLRNIGFRASTRRREGQARKIASAMIADR